MYFRDDFFAGVTSSTYDPPSYSRSSGGGGGSSYTGQPTSSLSEDSHFFGKHSAFSSSGTDVDKPSNKISSFGAMSSNSRSVGGPARSTRETHRGGVTGGSDSAQQRFTGAKSISSDQYFGRNASSNDQVSMMHTDHIRMTVCNTV